MTNYWLEEVKEVQSNIFGNLLIRVWKVPARLVDDFKEWLEVCGFNFLASDGLPYAQKITKSDGVFFATEEDVSGPYVQL